MKKTICFALVLVAAVLRAGDGGGAAPSSATHLFRVSAINDIFVFLPVSEIRSKADAESYLRWAAHVHGARGGAIRPIWDADGAIPLAAGQKYDAGFLVQPGDDAVDSSGSVRFVVKDVADGGVGRFSLALSTPLQEGAATPEICFTNAWVLSQERLFQRWREQISAGDAPGVRSQIRALRDSGRFRVDGGDAWKREVEQFVETTPSLWPALKVVNATGRKVAVSVLGGRYGEYFEPGQRKTVRVTKIPADGKVTLAARDEIPNICEYDFVSVHKEEYAWEPLGPADAEIVLEGSLGELRPKPRLDLGSLMPAEASPGALPEALSVSISYADAPADPVPARILKSDNGSPQVEIDPHRAVKGIELKAPGFQPLKLYKSKSIGGNLLQGICSTNAPVRIGDGSTRMRPEALPWPTLIVKNDSGEELILESGDLGRNVGETPVLKGMSKTIELDSAWRDSVSGRISEKHISLFATAQGYGTLLSTNLVVKRGQGRVEITVAAPQREAPVVPVAAALPADKPAAPSASPAAPAVQSVSQIKPAVPPLPSDTELDELQHELKRCVNLVYGRSTVKEKPGNVETARKNLRLLQMYWPLGQKNENKSWLRAFRMAVSHFAHCRGCDSCRILRKKTIHRGLDPKTEVFEVFGDWSVEEQIKFRRQTLWDWNTGDADWSKGAVKLDRRRLDIQVVAWARLIRRCLDDGDPLTQREALPRALGLWDAKPRNDKNMGGLLHSAYIHAELCENPNCPDCPDFRNAVRRGGSFEERRIGLLCALLCDNDAAFTGKAERPLTERDIQNFAEKIEEFRRTSQEPAKQ